jgi:integrase
MAREINKLSPRTVATKSKRGRYADGGGLYLQVSDGGAKSWLFRFTLNGRHRQMGLGAVLTVPVDLAREEAARCRLMLRDGLDPIEARKAEKWRRLFETASSLTFRECAERYIAAHEAGWRNEKHVSQWRNTLSTYTYSVFGELPVQAVDTGLVMRALDPIWRTKTETASRVRGRVEAVLDWATVRGHRKGENPARWRGHLEKLLPAKSKVRPVEHHAALPYRDMGAFIVDLRGREGIGARALEFAILTAARTGEVIGAKWEEIDLEARTWTIPPERMKARRGHSVPLSPAALSVIEAMREIRQSEFIFPGTRAKRPLSNMAFLMLLRRMGHENQTSHGFRSSFRDWAAERTARPNEVAEMALAHVVGDKVEAAYRRGDLLEKRRALMAAWGEFCAVVLREAEGGKVVALREA